MNSSSKNPLLEAGQETVVPPENQQLKRQKRVCCCVYSRKCVIITVGVLVALAITIGLLIFFLFPRIPQVSIDSFVYNGTSANATTKELDIKWNVKVDIKSDNYIPIKVISATVNGYPMKSDTLVLSGYEEDITIPARSDYKLNIVLTSPVTSTSIKDPYVQQILAGCIAGQTIQTRLYIVMDLTLTHWLGKTLNFWIDASVLCNAPELVAFL